MTAKLRSDLRIHYCHVPDRQKIVDPKFLMCSRHWNQVPQKLKQLVYANYRNGQEIDKKPTEEYLRVARLALDSVVNIK